MPFTKYLRIFAIFLLILSVVSQSQMTSAQSGKQNPVKNPLQTLQFDYLYRMSLGGDGYFTSVSLVNNYTILGGVVTNDVVTGGQNTPIFVSCTKKNFQSDLIKGNYSDTTYNCGYDGILAMLNPNGTVRFGTYIGGPYNDKVTTSAIDSGNNIIVGGIAGPGMIKNATYDSTADKDFGDGYVMKMNFDGKREWATYLGGSYVDSLESIKIDHSDNIIASGFTKSTDFPLLNAIDSTYEGSQIYGGQMFITKFAKNGTALWSTYLGGSQFDADYSLSVDKDNNVIVTGLTKSSDFPFVKVPEENQGKIDVFFIKISPDGKLLTAKLLGGFLNDVIQDTTFDQQGNIVMVGYTSSGDFPVVNGYQDTLNRDPNIKVYTDAIVMKMDTNGNILWSTYLGGKGADTAVKVEVTDKNEVVVLGTTASSNFPYYTPYNITSGLNALVSYPSGDQPRDVFTTMFTQNGAMEYSFYFGGVGDDFIYSANYYNRSIVLVGTTNSGDTFPSFNSNSTSVSSNYIGKFRLDGNYIPLPLPVNVSTTANSDQGLNLLDPIVIGIVLIVLYKPARSGISKVLASRKNDALLEDRENIRDYLSKLTQDQE